LCQAESRKLIVQQPEAVLQQKPAEQTPPQKLPLQVRRQEAAPSGSGENTSSADPSEL